MPNNKTVKQMAKNWLKNIYAANVAVALYILAISVFVYSLSSLIYSISGIIGTVVFSLICYIFLFAPAVLGCIFYVYRATEQKDTSIVEVAYPFLSKNAYLCTMKYVLLTTLRAGGIFLAVMAPYIAIRVFTSPSVYSALSGTMPSWTVMFWLLRRFFFIGGITAFIAVVSKYYAAPVIFMAGEGKSPAEAIYMARCVRSASNSSFIGFVFSMFLWIALSFLMLPAIFLLPYIVFAYVFYCKSAIAEYNKTQITDEYSYDPMGFPVGGNE